MAKKQVKKLVTYNYLLKEFGKVNKLLPDDRKLSNKEIRSIVSKDLYPSLKGQSLYKLKKRSLKAKISGLIDKVPPKVGCDPNLIDPEVYRSIDAFAIDEFLTNIIPNCINVKVSAGDMGETRIFNTRNYSYTRSGVRDIVEKVREYASEVSSDIDWSGVQQLKPNKPNDGNPENYYIEFILNLNGEPTKDVTPTRVKPKEPSQKRAATKTTNVIRDRIANLRAKKKKVGRVKKSVAKASKELKVVNKKITKIKTEKFKDKYIVKRTDILLKEINRIKRAYDKGLISKEDFEKLKARLTSQFGDGGEI